MDWIKLGVAPIPVDIRKNIKEYSLEYPLEYQNLIDEYLLTVSNTNLMSFSIYSDNDHVLSFGCNLHEKYLYSLTFYLRDNIIVLRSKDGYQFDKLDEKRSLKLKNIESSILSDKRIQKMLGIINFSINRIDFSQQN